MEQKNRKTISVVGSGPAALMFASVINKDKYDVTIYEKNNAPGRKFLVAGDGGFNLTHSENINEFIGRYTPPSFLERSLKAFTNEDLRSFLNSIGIETYVGSSKRVFPVKGIKPIEVLNAFLKVMEEKSIRIVTKHEWIGWDGDSLLFETNNGIASVRSDITVFALGGASWKVTGSDGSWSGLFAGKGIKILPFQPSNCAYKINWQEEFIKLAEGKALKNIGLSCNESSRLGEIVITSTGIEGGAVYALSPAIRKQLEEKGGSTVYLDLKPGISSQQIKDKFSNRGNRSIKKLLEDRLSFSDIQILLLKNILSKEDFTDLGLLAEKIKRLPLKINGMAPLDEAISTVGGVALKEVDEKFQLIKLANTFCIGEMLNWDAPTGGYLLQGCFSMGHYCAAGINKIIP